MYCRDFALAKKTKPRGWKAGLGLGASPHLPMLKLLYG